MSRQPTREDIQRYLQRWQQLKVQYGDQAVNVAEFNHLTKVIRFLQAQAMQRQQQGSQTHQPASHPAPLGSQPRPQMSPLSHLNAPHLTSTSQYHPPGTPYATSAGLFADSPMQLGFTPQGQNHTLASQSQAQFNPSQPSMGMAGMGAGTDVAATYSSPFTELQMQLFKLQVQVAKFFTKTGNGFLPIPNNLIELATDERLMHSNGTNYNYNGANPSYTNLSAVPLGNASGTLGNASLGNTSGPLGNTSAPLSPESEFQRQLSLSGTRPNSIAAPRTALPAGSMPDMDLRRARSSLAQKASGTPKTGAAKLCGAQAVMYPHEPPVEYEAYIKDHDITNQLVLPVSKPGLQVDTFVLPRVLSSPMQDIPFSGFHVPQSKLRLPSLLPYGIDVNDLMSTREYYISLQIDRRVLELRARQQQLDDLPEKDAVTIELAQLELLPYQKEIRGCVAGQLWHSRLLLLNSHPNFLAKFPELSVKGALATEGLYKQQLYLLVQAQNAKHQGLVKVILEAGARRRDRRASRPDKAERLRMKINSFHAQTAREEQKKIERMDKQRLQALKLNDEEAYLKLLDHTKDTRITHLLNQTNQFLENLAQAVQTLQREAKHSQGAVDSDDADSPAGGDDKRQKIDYYQVAHRIKEEVTRQPSILVGGTLKEYQLKGLQWMVSLFNNHLNGILADEMGLGKTIQTISLLLYLCEVKQVTGPFLVIVPLSTLTNWNIEFDKWCPALKKISFKGSPAERRVMYAEIRLGNFNVVLTTFEYVIRDKPVLSRVKWVHMVIDEGHRMKNASSKLSETLTQYYHSDYRLILTGTPLQNNLHELWALLNFVLPKIFNSVKSFDEWFNTPITSTGSQDKIELNEEETLLVIRRLHKVLRPFLLRRLKRDVEKDLPDKVEKVVKCKMSALQLKLYRMMLNHNAIVAGTDETGKPILIKGINNQLMQLRKICNHPFVYSEIEQQIHPLADTNDLIWRIAGKFELLDRILPKFSVTGHRVLIFFQMTQIMNIMEDFLHYRGLNYMRLDGATRSDERTLLLHAFNDPASEYFCFLLSTRAGGLGLNLQAADTVIIFDSDWNPHQDLQAQDRAHRIGQKNEVRILRLITEDSIEEMILERAAAKLEIDGKVIQAGKFDNKSTAEEQEALLRALIEKEEDRRANGNDEDSDLDDDELNQVIARNDHELLVFRRLDQERVAQSACKNYPTRLFNDSELPECYRCDSRTFFKTAEEVSEEYGRGNRERKIAVYDDNLTEEEWLKRIQGTNSEGSDADNVAPVLEAPRKKGRPRKIVPDMGLYNGDLEDRPARKRPQAVTSTRGRRARPGRPRLKPSANRITPTVDLLPPEERMVLQNNMELIYGALLDYKEGERKLSDLFLVKPSRRLYPDYYVLIKHPLALDMVKKRINNKTYSCMRDFLEELHLIFSNACIYNEEGSIVYRDAQHLELLALDMYRDMYLNESEEERARTLNFSDFDKAHLLRPNKMLKSHETQPVVLQGAHLQEELQEPPPVAPIGVHDAVADALMDVSNPVFDMKDMMGDGSDGPELDME
ncbi:hypothetical protein METBISCDRAFT_16953 [Metschnikowia bicuspidata]|uniref:SNF2-family ATP dependent chromatin remodeling factor snf21 n=1 Tax=Metschnikowia bicuspidata TaxID=27322 RepID=A0A4P9ZE43_9ASCO|nr:hypothetical protein METBISCDRAFT_16953 [Metschnikowia bicuspidata]